MLGSLRRSGLLVALAAALAAGSMPVFASQPTMISTAPRPVKAGKRAQFRGATSASRYGRKSAGITMAQQQRAAAKKRGVARNRRHHR